MRPRSAGALIDAFGRSASRQPVYVALLFVPILLGLVARGLPRVLLRFIPDFDPAPFIRPMLATMSGFPAYLYGLLAALMLLDERDLGLLPVFRATPISDGGLLWAKILPAAALAAVGTPTALILASVGTPAEIPAASVTASGFIAAPTTAVYALLTVSLARTKVQGMTVGKVLGTVLPAPLLLILIPSAWRFAALLVPSSWTAALVLGVRGRGLCLLGGMLFNGLLLTVVFPWCRRRYCAG